MKNYFAGIAAVLFFFMEPVSGYLVGPSLNLEKLAGEADLIFKATAISSETVQDHWFKPCSGFDAVETRFQVISVVKGPAEMKLVRFRHYDEAPQDQGRGRMFEPQYYHFEKDGTFIVFASKTDNADVFRQLQPNHTSKKDQGALRCFDARPVASGKLKEAFWAELMALLASPNSKDVIHAIRQLDEMSDVADSDDATRDFGRTEVLKAIGPSMTHGDEEIARAAITVIGSKNPYLSDDSAQFWLATVGSANVPGIGKRDPKMRNPGGELFRKELCSIADGKASVATRALAIRSLGLVKNNELLDPVGRWLADVDPSVRAAAVLLLADFPGDDTRRRLAMMAADPVPEVRWRAAHAIGFMQAAGMAETLGTLLKDSDQKVRRAAGLSLLSFSPKSEPVAKVFRENLENQEFSPLFLNALAVENPEPYLEPLALAIKRKAEPRNWSGGQVPAFTAFNILFKYLQSQPADAVRAGKFDRYLDAMEKGYVTGSSEPRDIYAFYLQRGMTERAKAYRVMAKDTASYDIDYFFKMVDQNPSAYKR